MSHDLGLKPKATESTVQALMSLLNKETCLYKSTLEAHWNIKGSNFACLHELFQAQYEHLQELIDELAERVRILGHPVKNAHHHDSCCGHGNCSSSNHDVSAWELHTKGLVAEHADLATEIRNAIQSMEGKSDFGTEDMLTAFLRWHEKQHWFLSSHLK